MAKVTRSATLATNEVFILPPGAVLKGATDTEAFTNSCVTPTLETLNCWVAVLGTATIAQQGSDTIYWGANNAQIVGYVLNGLRTNFTGDYRNSGASLNFTSDVWTAMGNELRVSLSSIIYTDGSYRLSDGNDNGTANYFLIQTIPSVANNLFLLYRSVAPSDDELTIEYEVPFKTIASMTSEGYVDFPTCPTVVVS